MIPATSENYMDVDGSNLSTASTLIMAALLMMSVVLFSVTLTAAPSFTSALINDEVCVSMAVDDFERSTSNYGCFTEDIDVCGVFIARKNVDQSLFSNVCSTDDV